MGICDFGDLVTAVVKCLGSERITSNVHKAMYWCGKTWLKIDLTCTEVCQVGVSETQQSERE